MMKALLDEKTLLNPAETIELFGLSKRKFDKFLASGKCDSFVLLYGSRRLIVRKKFEEYLKLHKDEKEMLRNGKHWSTKGFKAQGAKKRRINP